MCQEYVMLTKFIFLLLIVFFMGKILKFLGNLSNHKNQKDHDAKDDVINLEKGHDGTYRDKYSKKD